MPLPGLAANQLFEQRTSYGRPLRAGADALERRRYTESHPRSALGRKVDELITPSLFPLLDLPETKREEHLSQRESLFSKAEGWGYSSERKSVSTPDGASLDTVQLTHVMQSSLPPQDQKWVVYLGGSGYCYEQAAERIAFHTQKIGANIYMGNSRGVMDSRNPEGAPPPDLDTNLIDAETMVQDLLKRGVKPENIMLYGHCAGGAAATQIAASHPGMNLIVDRSFVSLSSQVEAHIIKAGYNRIVAKIGAFVATFFGWELDSKYALSHVTGTVIVIDANDDKVIPLQVRLGNALAKQFFRYDIGLNDRGKGVEKKESPISKTNRCRFHFHVPGEHEHISIRTGSVVNQCMKIALRIY